MAVARSSACESSFSEAVVHSLQFSALEPFVPRRADSKLLCFFEPRFAKSDARKNCLSQIFAKSLFCNGLILRTRDFARSQEVENRERKTEGNGESWSEWVSAKSARKCEKPRQAWGPTGLFKGKGRLFTGGYPLTLKLDILGQIAKAKLTCPSHKVSTTAIEHGLAVLLESGGMLDRDFILNLEGLAGHSFAVTAPDGDQKMILASFCPQLPVHEATPLMMKILVDCSGSMQGDSIEAAKSAIHSILQELNSDDLISYSRFGDDVSHDLSSLRTCTPATVHFVASAISKTEANLGGTELNDALISTFNDIEVPSLAIHKPSVLLITDGDVWDVETVVKASAEAGQRVFAIGVGSSPAESLLRDLAEKTGGACELVSPNEDISAAIVRMFRRMRGAQAAQLKVEWSGNPDWQSPLPAQIYDGETVHVFARFSEAPKCAPESPRVSWRPVGLSQTDVMA